MDAATERGAAIGEASAGPEATEAAAAAAIVALAQRRPGSPASEAPTSVLALLLGTRARSFARDAVAGRAAHGGDWRQPSSCCDASANGSDGAN